VLVPRLAVCALTALVLAACGAGSEDPGLDALRQEAEALVPASSEVVDMVEGSCVQFVASPACIRIFVAADLPEERRADALEETARAAGWEVVSRRRLADGTAIELRSDDYRAYAAVWGNERAAPCREGEPDRDCADEIQVVED
jgi:hypothetical protein